MKTVFTVVALLTFGAEFALPQQTPQVSPSDLGYRLGSIEAKLEAISKDLAEIKTSQNTQQASMTALTSRLDKLETQSTWVFGGLFAIAALIVGNIINGYMSRGRDRRPPDESMTGPATLRLQTLPTMDKTSQRELLDSYYEALDTVGQMQRLKHEMDTRQKQTELHMQQQLAELKAEAERAEQQRLKEREQRNSSDAV